MFDQWVPDTEPARSGMGVARLLETTAASARALGRDAHAALTRLEPSHEWWAHGAAGLSAVLVVWAALLSPMKAKAKPGRYDEVVRILRLSGGDLSEKGLEAFAAGMDPASAALARRFAPAAPVDLTPPPVPGQGLLDPTATVPSTVPSMDPEAARLLNASIPVASSANPAAQPFFLKTSGLLDETRAEDCLTAAVYYEAGFESRAGQEAVAQVVLNRVRHPAYPKTVCGVVFQGSNRTTGCQFTFTCDGSLFRRPNETAWRRAREVAVAALHGHVAKSVGNATHYHADYVAPYWSTSLVKVATIGAHIFYRWTGGAGKPPAFNGLYAGAEPEVLPIGTGAPTVASLDPVVDAALAPVSAPGPMVVTPQDRATPVEAANAPAPRIEPLVPAPVAEQPKPKPPQAEERRRDNWRRLPIRTEW